MQYSSGVLYKENPSSCANCISKFQWKFAWTETLQQFKKPDFVSIITRDNLQKNVGADSKARTSTKLATQTTKRKLFPCICVIALSVDKKLIIAVVNWYCYSKHTITTVIIIPFRINPNIGIHCS